MINRPYGPATKNAPYMVKDRCTKHYPKKFNDATTIDQNGFSMYCRRLVGAFVEIKGV